jgi:hypothetical protein
MDISMGTLIGQLFVYALVGFAFIVAIRFLMAATRWMNLKSRSMKRESVPEAPERTDSA